MYYTSRCQGCSKCQPTDDKYGKYYRARLWATDHLDENRHAFAVFFAESDWDDTQAALRDWMAQC